MVVTRLAALTSALVICASISYAFVSEPIILSGAPPAPPAVTPGTIPCDIGPNYTGSIPAGASRAGYTHCAVNLDFTQFTNVNQFMDCFGASTPLLYFDTTNPEQSPCNSSHFSMVSDGGSNSFQMTMLASEYPTYQQNYLYSFLKAGSTVNGSYTGYTFPEGYYVELVWRSVSIPNYGGKPGLYVLTYSPFMYTAAYQNSVSGAWTENDFDELYSDGGSGGIFSNGPYIDGSGAVAFPSGSGYNLAICSPGGVPPCYGMVPTSGTGHGSVLDPTTQYRTWGLRLTSDGSAAISTCYYRDDAVVNGSQSSSAQLGCNQATGLPTSSLNTDKYFTSRVGLVFGALGAGDTYKQGWTSMTGNNVQNTKRMTIWTCAGWRDNNSNINQSPLSNQCYNGSLTGTP